VVVDGELTTRGPGQDDRLPYGALALAQPDAERILEGYWRRYGHAIERGRTLTGLQQDDDGVSATLSTGEVVRSRYLVGCDGAHSTVRKTLGTAFEGERFERTFLLGDVHLDWDRPHRENWQFIELENGELRNVLTVIANPTAPGRYRLSSSIEDSLECPDHPPLELLREVMGPALPPGVTMSDLRWSSRYNISHRIAAEYRSGRVFLAGDAAHIHPPIGGLGMNTGLQDAYNLGWKLSAVCRGQLPEAILDSYHDERHPVGSKVVQVTAARMARAMSGQPPQGGDEPPLFDSQLNIRYEPGLLVAGETPPAGLPRPGDRLPAVQGLRRAHVAGAFRLAELFRDGRFQLFSKGVDHAAFHSLAERALGDLLRCWAVLDDEEPPEAMGYFLDPQDGWSQEVGRGAVLVRPDNVIGWRGWDPAGLGGWLEGFARVATLA
jgi:2-polyprenyl-6-methoxyphenol hydroxylase-like FAD-dependent oxidoreductase